MPKFPTNPINALEASARRMGDPPNLEEGFPTNPINALEASLSYKGEVLVSASCFQLIQLTHWKRAVLTRSMTGSMRMFPTNPINALEARLCNGDVQRCH